MMEQAANHGFEDLRILAQAGDAQKFLSAFIAANDANPLTDADLWYKAGTFYLQVFDVDSAYSCMRKAHELDIRYVLLLAGFIQEHYPVETELSIRLLKESLPIVPAGHQRFAMLNRIAVGHELLGRHADAAQAFLSALIEKPDETWVYGFLKRAIIRDHEVELQRTDPFAARGGEISAGMNTARSGVYEKSIGQIDDPRRWHASGDVRFFPLNLDPQIPLETLIDGIVKKSSRLPSYRPFNASSRILTIGSCFARNLRHRFVERGFTSTSVEIPEELNNTLAVKNFIQWSLEGHSDDPAEAYHRRDGQIERFDFGQDNSLHKAALEGAEGIVITYGVGEIWRDRETGNIFWHGVPASLYDPTRHEPILSDVGWNAENIHATLTTLRRHNPTVPIFITLSPVPLNATFRPVSIWEADCASKSVLRTAIEQAFSIPIDGVYYWPSFEVIRWSGSHRANSLFSFQGDEDATFPDARHVRKSIVETIVDAFIERYFAL